jgi:hypothetical protein
MPWRLPFYVEVTVGSNWPQWECGGNGTAAVGVAAIVLRNRAIADGDVQG